jgi:DNA-binding NarL/FixJ family response regulator
LFFLTAEADRDSARLQNMSIVENRPVRPAMGPAEALTRALVIAPEARERTLITGILGQAGQLPDAVLADRGALDRHEVGEATLLIVACDVDRPAEITGLRKLCRAAKGAAIVVVSPPVTATAVRRTLDAGADALVFASELTATLIPTLRAVESGQSVVPRNLRAGVKRPYFSFRERQVLTLVSEGHTNAQIAEALFLAESTIKSHMASIFTKLGVHSRKEAGAVFLDMHASEAGLGHDSPLELQA